MEYTKLGNTDIEISRLCLGCMSLGDASKGMHTWAVSYEESKEIIGYAYENGINFFDTAMSYQAGTGEEYLGRAVKELGIRDEVVLATKYTPRNSEELLQTYTGKAWIEKCIDDSLRRLDTDHIDLYIMHMWDYKTPVLETLEALTKAKKAGKIRAFGVSNCYAWQLAKANMLARKEELDPFVSIQSHYNLLAREDEREILPYCREDNIAVTPYSSLAGGRLSRRPEEQTLRTQLDNINRGKYGATVEPDSRIIRRVIEIAEKRSASMIEVSLAWLLTKATAPIVGATKKSQIDGFVKAAGFHLSEDEIQYLEELYIPHKLVGVIAMNPVEIQAKI
ncbi:MAG: aldo/keto reductase [Subdoligranulum sp.]|nr:aldo/keto reductase [Subdoligranulum sp.]